MGRTTIAAALAALIGGHAATASAQGAPLGASAQASAGESAPEAREETDEGTDGGDVVGVALMIVGGVAAGAGATILVIDAANEEAARDEPGADAGLEGVRGRSGGETATSSDVVPAVGLGLLVGGAAVHLIGVVIAFGSHDEDERDRSESATRVQPIVGPTFTGVRGSF